MAAYSTQRTTVPQCTTWLDFQSTLIILNALEQLTEIAFAKSATATSLLGCFLAIWLLDSVLTAYSLNDLQKQSGPVSYRFGEHLQQYALRIHSSLQYLW